MSPPLPKFIRAPPPAAISVTMLISAGADAAAQVMKEARAVLESPTATVKATVLAIVRAAPRPSTILCADCALVHRAFIVPSRGPLFRCAEWSNHCGPTSPLSPLRRWRSGCWRASRPPQSSSARSSSAARRTVPSGTSAATSFRRRCFRTVSFPASAPFRLFRACCALRKDERYEIFALGSERGFPRGHPLRGFWSSRLTPSDGSFAQETRRTRWGR